ncbi:hypothetical protein BDN72DRAFT_799984 [Pluteus cervinus]|uniref:Uncharacterized protein n=1 Tax=Pluteus cervinus TaxID=181527 RepID=A0ACD3ALA9_9AGAR|nr:hypothetical protein BDN72DRAFT_799984 [Pluteus cervinus]
MATQHFQPKVDALFAALGKRPPFCTGVTSLDNHGVLFYRKGENRDAGYLNFASADEEALQDLSAACDLASFGHGQQTVYDETYRKARKLDTDRFASMIDIHSSGIAQHVSDELLEGKNFKRTLRFELYKLNVYEKDSFFKPHTDTPRAENMFGSLVITFPTPHVGGALVLRHNGDEWAVDSSSILSQQSKPSICFIAFYSDVEHEVLPLQSGHRVTLTYNLYIEKSKLYSEIPQLPTIPIHKSAPDCLVFKTALNDFLQDPDVFPNGGVLAFGLRFKYPIILSETNLEQIIHVLKGCDATIKDVAHSLSLEVVPEVLIHDNENGVDVMYPQLCDWDGIHIASWAEYLAEKDDLGFVVHEVGEPEPDFDNLDEEVKVKDVIWVTPKTRFTNFKATFLRGGEDDYYGNEAGITCVYGSVVLAVMVGPPGHRETLQEIPKREKLHERDIYELDRRGSDLESD